jgi:hypothetical protein
VELIWTTRNIQEKGEKPSRAALQYRLFIWQPYLWRCDTARETASHVLCESVALAEFRCRSLDSKHF